MVVGAAYAYSITTVIKLESMSVEAKADVTFFYFDEGIQRNIRGKIITAARKNKI